MNTLFEKVGNNFCVAKVRAGCCQLFTSLFDPQHWIKWWVGGAPFAIREWNISFAHPVYTPARNLLFTPAKRAAFFSLTPSQSSGPMQTTPHCTGKDATHHFKFYIYMSFDFCMSLDSGRIYIIGVLNWLRLFCKRILPVRVSN